MICMILLPGICQCQFSIGLVADGMAIIDACCRHTGAEILVAVAIAIQFHFFRRSIVTYQNVNIALSSYSEQGDAAVLQGEEQFYRPILIPWYCFCTDLNIQAFK